MSELVAPVGPRVVELSFEVRPAGHVPLCQALMDALDVPDMEGVWAKAFGAQKVEVIEEPDGYQWARITAVKEES